jgi:hypothetical protein
MQVETIGEALAAGWRIHARCLGGIVDNTRSTAKRRHRVELSLETLAWTRGRNMPLSGPAGTDDAPAVRQSPGQLHFRAAACRQARAGVGL